MWMDCIFLLSLGLEMDYIFNELEPEKIQETTTLQFLEVYRATSQFDQDRSYNSFHKLFSNFLYHWV